MMCENWNEFFEFNEGTLTRAKHPAIDNVQTSTRNLRKNFKFGRRKFLSASKLQMGLIVSLIFWTLHDLAYNRNISPYDRTFNNRSVISSQAALLLAHTSTALSPVDVRTISSIAATNVFVLPVPILGHLKRKCKWDSTKKATKWYEELRWHTGWTKQKIRHGFVLAEYDVLHRQFLLFVQLQCRTTTVS